MTDRRGETRDAADLVEGPYPPTEEMLSVPVDPDLAP
ncbi:hypothetical protein LCGC14_1660880 [marine sediment metagenome]|uniref:Uncharacterized protein n=1 Tax=marine sediment metagenome TaxID=412755 RepID=A0A0F9IGJ3_9ZZZZ